MRASRTARRLLRFGQLGGDPGRAGWLDRAPIVNCADCRVSRFVDLLGTEAGSSGFQPPQTEQVSTGGATSAAASPKSRVVNFIQARAEADRTMRMVPGCESQAGGDIASMEWDKLGAILSFNPLARADRPAWWNRNFANVVDPVRARLTSSSRSPAMSMLETCSFHRLPSGFQKRLDAVLSAGPAHGTMGAGSESSSLPQRIRAAVLGSQRNPIEGRTGRPDHGASSPAVAPVAGLRAQLAQIAATARPFPLLFTWLTPSAPCSMWGRPIRARLYGLGATAGAPLWS